MVTGCARTALNWQQRDFFSSVFSAGSWQNGGVGQFEYKWEKVGPATRKRDKGKCGQMKKARGMLGLTGQGSVKGPTEIIQFQREDEGKIHTETVRKKETRPGKGRPPSLLVHPLKLSMNASPRGHQNSPASTHHTAWWLHHSSPCPEAFLQNLDPLGI